MKSNFGTFFLNLCCISFVSAFSLSVGATPQTEVLYHKLKNASAQERPDVLSHLPEQLKENFVLINDSKSRQKGTFELPRVLHFSKTADFIVTSSGHPVSLDAAAEDLEIMEFDRKNNKWVLAKISFGKNGLKAPVYNSKNCLSCHGKNPRPIWGGYPSWPTAYGGKGPNGGDFMGPEEKVLFRQFVSKAKTHEAYRHLKIFVSQSGYDLQSMYPAPNAVFTARIANLHANHLIQKVHASRPAKADPYNYLAQRFHCANVETLDASVNQRYSERLNTDAEFKSLWSGKPKPLDVQTKLLRLIGVDPTEDFELTRPTSVNNPVPSFDALNWSAGSDSLGDYLGFKLLSQLVQSDPKLRDWFESVIPIMDKIEWLTFHGTNSELAEMDKDATKDDFVMSLYPFFHYNIFYSVLGSSKKPICDHLMAKSQVNN
ncbi:MAG: hypothetical protein V4736_02140 [Bdellovibrionota bacterium]